MSWTDEQSVLNSSGELYSPVTTVLEQPPPLAGPLLNTCITQLDQAAQEAAFYIQNEQSYLWAYETGPDPALPTYESPGSSLPLEEIDWQGVIDAGEGPPPLGDDTRKQSRRKEQNRAAQRAFRERKDQALRELQEAVKSSKDRAAELEAENIRLRDMLKESKVEIDTLRSVSIPSQQVIGGDSVGFNVSGKRMIDENGDVILLKIKLGEAASAER